MGKTRKKKQIKKKLKKKKIIHQNEIDQIKLNKQLELIKQMKSAEVELKRLLAIQKQESKIINLRTREELN